MTAIEKSLLITDDEYRSFCTLIEHKCKVLSVAITRLYKADGNSWKYYSTGIITLVKDNPKKKYCLQLMDMDKYSKIWETVVALNFRYIVSNNQVHCFNTSDGPCLLSFANIDEAATFSTTIIALTQRRKQQRESRQVTHNENNIQPQLPSTRTVPINNTSVNKPNKAGKKKLTKEDISNPSDFKHLDHMGINECFFQNPQDEMLRKFLKDKNMEFLLDNAEYKQDIYDIIERQGGVQQLNMEIENQNSDKRSVAPPIRNNPPPIPPNRNHNVPPAPPISKNPPPHPPLNAPGPPPPPPPPPPPAPGPPIHSTKPNPSVPKAPEPSFQGGGLLSEIQGFNKNALKPKNESRVETKPEPEVESGAAAGSILESLAKYLEDRKNMINADSDDESDNEEDEWED